MANVQESVIRRISARYNTNIDTTSHLANSLGIEVTEEILKMHPAEIRDTARVNLLKSTRGEAIRMLAEEGIRAVPLPDIPEGIEILLGADLLGYSITYLAGVVSPQGYGSMATVHALDPRPGETILDLAAAPGNKTTYIAERMQNTGLLVANDLSRARLLSVRSNLNRHGVRNVVVTNYDGTTFPTKRKFDRVLLDAPCTGEGLLVSKPRRRRSRDRMDPYILQRTQQRLLRRAIRVLKPGGVIVYSTCSLNTVENEEVLEPFESLLEFEEISLQAEEPVVESEKIPHAIRLLPNRHYCDGFFIVRGVRR